MTFEELLAQYPRLAVVGAPRTGKTAVTRQITDRPVIHTDDWMDWPWRDVPALVAAACEGLDSFVVEGVRAPDALRRGGLEVDAVLYLNKPKIEQTPAQQSMGIGIHTVLEQWADAHPEVPIVPEEQLTVSTLDHANIPQQTRRYAQWTLDASRIERTPQGGLRIHAKVSKAGVFNYLRGKQIVREYRPASELRKPEALASLKGAPIVVMHPEVNGGAVDTDNAKDLQVGHFEDPVFSEETQAIEGYVVTNDAETIRRIEAGELSDISSAYDNGREFVPGFTDAREPYDLVQTDYVFNHVALGPPGWGRQGQDVGLTLDADDNQVAALPPSQSSEEAMVINNNTLKPRTPTRDEGDPTQTPAAQTNVPPPPPAAAPTEDGLTPEDMAGLKDLVKMLPALNKLLNTGSADAPVPAPTSEDGEGVVPKTEDMGANEEKKTMDAADIERIAQEGVEVRTEAISVLGSKYSPKGKSTRQVRTDVIQTLDSKFTADGKSNEAISAAYDMALKAGVERNNHAVALGKTRRHGVSSLDQGEDPPRKPVGHQAYDAWKDSPS